MDATLLFLGVIVSVVVQLIKIKFGTDRLKTLLSVVVLSLLVGAGSWYLKNLGLWESFYQVIITAGAVYAFIIKNGEVLLKYTDSLMED